MDCLTFNAVLRIEAPTLDGFYRVVAVPPATDIVWLAYIGVRDEGAVANAPAVVGTTTPVDRYTLRSLAEAALLTIVDLDDPGALGREEALEGKGSSLWEHHQAVMVPFLDPVQLQEALVTTGGIGPLVQTALRDSDTSRATVYRLWRLLCARGFTGLSLMPSYDQCGAPGVLRPVEGGRQKPGVKSPHERVGAEDPFPQRGATQEDRIKIAAHVGRQWKAGMTTAGLYDEVIRAIYVRRYVQTPRGLEAVMPPPGTFPNKRQFRHIVETEFKALERAIRRTTTGHWNRNRRGLRGHSYDGVAGPGHAYAIDSTIGDVHLRSAVNRAWVVGRPIVYVIVDVWSTAVVGFYVCLRPPSWRAAKIALYSTFADPAAIAELWGYQYRPVLEPAPTAPFTLWCDRGEYLSAGARETLLRLGFNSAFNPAYRPDLKGLVEVLHRIAKDAQFSDFIPGAIDARRLELDLKTDARESALTLREYVQYLYMVFTQYNAHANREDRMTSEMVAAGVRATPAGLWRFGHEMGFGFRRHTPHDQLAAGLLEQTTLTARRTGNFLESLQYDGDLAVEEQWSAQARNFGVLERTAYRFPGYAGKLWVPGATGLHEFHLRPNGRTLPQITFDEWRDTLGVALLQRSQREYERFCDAVRNLDARDDLVKNAIAETTAAEARSSGPVLTTLQARSLETSAVGTALLAQPVVAGPAAHTGILAAAETSDYDALMDDLLAGVLPKGAA